MQEKEQMITAQNKPNYVVLYNDDGHYKRNDFKASFDRQTHVARHEFSFRTTKYPAEVHLGLNDC